MLYALHVRVVEASDIPRMDANATDAYCILQTSSETRNTFVVKNSMRPRWNQEFHFNVSAPNIGSLHITMRDKDAFKDDNISQIDIQFCSLPLGQVIDQWYDMIPFNRVRKGGRLHLVLHMSPANAPPFVPTAGMAPAYPPQGYAAPPPAYPPQGYAAAPPPAYPPQGYAAPPPAYPPQGYAAPPPAYPPQGYAAPPPAYPAPGYGAPTGVYTVPAPPMAYGAQPYPVGGYKQKKHKTHYGKRSSSSSS